MISVSVDALKEDLRQAEQSLSDTNNFLHQIKLKHDEVDDLRLQQEGSVSTLEKLIKRAEESAARDSGSEELDETSAAN